MSANITSICPHPMKATSNGVFQGDNPLDFALPLAILQICLVIALTRGLAFILRPLRQPRVIAEIIGGVLLGPSALGRNHNYLHTVFPTKSLTVLDTLANLGLLFFLFLVGLELDLNSLRRTGKKALGIALAGISLPFVLGIGVSFVLRSTISKGVHGPPFIVFMGVALSITAFPVLARILAELKLLTTDVGRMAMSAAAVNDVAAWILLALAIALSGSTTSPIITLWVFLTGSGFIVFCALVIPPLFNHASKRSPEGEPVDEIYVCATLATVLAAGFCTDAIGIHALFGAFVVGVLMPKEGHFSSALVEKVEDIVSGLFLPLYFVSSGLKTDVTTISGVQSWGLLVLVTFTACFGKIVGTVVVSLCCKMPFQEAMALGFLMNTKGLVELIVLNIGKDRKVLNDQTFAIMVLMALFTTFITTPLVTAVYKQAKRLSRIDYKYRTIEHRNPDTQLRIMVCFQSAKNVPTIINLIEALRGTKIQTQQGLRVYAMHLMELSERTSAILMVHKARKNGLPFSNKSHSNQIVVAFESFGNLSRVTVRPMTAISALTTMHEDVCSSAEQKGVAMLILTHDAACGELGLVNQRVLEWAPCSVGILVDRGLGGNSQVTSSHVAFRINVFLFGGRDDCEALAFGAHVADHPGVSLTVVRFNMGAVDEEIVGKVRSMASVTWVEREVGNGEDGLKVLREFSSCDLIVVGRRPTGDVVGHLMELKGECGNLGTIGEILTSSDVTSVTSVLVVKQYYSDLVSKGCDSTELNLGQNGGWESN